MTDTVFTFILLVIAAGYFVPTGLAIANRQRFWPAFLVVNFFMGWNFAVWLVLLLAAFYKPVPPARRPGQGPPRVPRARWYEPVNEGPPDRL
jgi:hypothetical protein